MKDSGEFINVYVKSRKVPSRAVLLEYYSPSIIGIVKSSRRSIEFEYWLDEAQQLMLEEAERVAQSTGIPIKVVDLSKLNFVFRLVRQILKFPKSPTIVLPGMVFSGILGIKQLDERNYPARWLEEQIIPVHPNR
jgi:hypothetical protein